MRSVQRRTLLQFSIMRAVRSNLLPSEQRTRSNLLLLPSPRRKLRLHQLIPTETLLRNHLTYRLLLARTATRPQLHPPTRPEHHHHPRLQLVHRGGIMQHLLHRSHCGHHDRISGRSGGYCAGSCLLLSSEKTSEIKKSPSFNYTHRSPGLKQKYRVR